MEIDDDEPFMELMKAKDLESAKKQLSEIAYLMFEILENRSLSSLLHRFVNYCITISINA